MLNKWDLNLDLKLDLQNKISYNTIIYYYYKEAQEFNSFFLNKSSPKSETF